MTEDDFQTRVIDAAKAHGWLVHHTRPARTAQGWRTPVQGHNGAPDLMLARRGTVLHVELKSDRGRLSTAQLAWRDQLGMQWRLWRPSTWESALAELAEPEPRCPCGHPTSDHRPQTPEWGWRA